MVTRVTFLVVFIVVSSVQAEDGPIVNTAIGTIRGVKSEDGQYNMYMGIPYARVNESNPFGASLPYPEFDEIFEANDDSAICPQIEEFNNTIVGDLDCLRLNIYTPTNISSDSRLPVFVWIYGGQFQIGFYGRFLYGPKYLVRHDVIVATINYRLGPYGFMCLDIPEVPGNEGFKDQIKAFRWLKSHISAFGGDPDRITAVGTSAGAMSIDFHLLRDNNEEKLFESAILQSGTSFVPRYIEPLLDAPIILAKYFEFATDNIYEAIAFLADLDPRNVIQALHASGISSYMYPCVEKYFSGVDNYMTRNWLMAPTTGINNMTVMIGINDDETPFARHTAGPGAIPATLSLRFNTDHADFHGMSELVEQFFLGDEDISDVIEDFVDFAADSQFVYPAYRGINKFLDNDVGNIYLYNFSYVGERNFVRRRINATTGGAYHADEFGYLFEMIFIPEEPSVEDQLTIDRMTTMWTNFVKYGDPTPERTDLLDVKWEPIVPGSPMYSMNIDKQLTLITSPIAKRVAFWDMFYEKNRHLELLNIFR